MTIIWIDSIYKFLSDQGFYKYFWHSAKGFLKNVNAWREAVDFQHFILPNAEINVMKLKA